MENQFDLFSLGFEVFEEDGNPVVVTDAELLEDDLYEVMESRDASIDDHILSPQMSIDEYRGIARELLKFSIQEAFGMSRGGKPFRDDDHKAENWLFSDNPLDDDAYPYSFRNCCRVLNMDPDDLRGHLRYIERRLAKCK